MCSAPAPETIGTTGTAKTLGEPVTALTARDGFVAGKTRRVSYAELIGNKHFNMPLDNAAKRKPKAQWTILGKPVNSLDRPAIMTGRFPIRAGVPIPPLSGPGPPAAQRPDGAGGLHPGATAVERFDPRPDRA